MDVLGRFGQRVRALRSERGWSQEDFAAECEVHRTYMGGVERGERNVSLVNIERIARALGMTLSELFEGVEHSKPRGGRTRRR